MSLPEISRRCLTCGAAVRAGSRFCQQCGKALEAEAAPGASEERGADAARATVPPTGEWSRPAEEPPPTKDLTPPTREFAAFEQSPGAVEPQTMSPAPAPLLAAPSERGAVPEAPVVGASESRDEEALAVAAAEDAGRAGDLRGRVARVREGTRARVGRMREEAIVVLEETPDDSGLRFVLAAAALFVVFLVLLFLSTTLLR